MLSKCSNLIKTDCLYIHIRKRNLCTIEQSQQPCISRSTFKRISYRVPFKISQRFNGRISRDNQAHWIFLKECSDVYGLQIFILIEFSKQLISTSKGKHIL